MDEAPAFSVETIAKRKIEILEIAFTSIILNLFDSVIKQVNDETSACRLWTKLESLFLRKSLSNKIFLKKKLFGFKMEPSKALELNLDDFKKVSIELANIGEAISDENQAVILLNFLPKSFNAIRVATEYGRDSLSLDVVVATLRYKELKMKIGNKKMFVGTDALSVMGRSEKREFKNSKS